MVVKNVNGYHLNFLGKKLLWFKLLHNKKNVMRQPQAAHCCVTYQPEDMNIVLGTHDLENDYRRTTVQVLELMVHPNFDV